MLPQIGFATSWMNPFSVAIAQGIASTAVVRCCIPRFTVVLFYLAGVGFYAALQRTNQVTGGERQAETINARFSATDGSILLVFLVGLIWVIWGVTTRAYYIPEIAAQFFVIGIIAGLVAIVGKRLTANGVADAFNQGAKDLLPAALIVGFAKGLVLLLGGDDPATPSTLNTILHHTSNAIGDFSAASSAVLMLVFQSVFNFFIASGRVRRHLPCR